jgi:hypothetical protein
MVPLNLAGKTKITATTRFLLNNPVAPSGLMWKDQTRLALRSPVRVQAEFRRPALTQAGEVVALSPPTRRAKADPLVLHLIEMDGRIILHNGKIEVCGRKTADRGHHRIGGNDPVALRGNKADPRA